MGILLLVAGLSDAQERFVGAAAVASWQPEGVSPTQAGPLVPRGPIGGHGFGIGVGGGFEVTPRVRFGIEMTVPSRIPGIQGSVMSLDEVAFRDVIVSPMLRFGRRPIVFVAGMSWIFESTVRRSRTRDVFGTLGALGEPQSSVRQTWGYTVGVDAPIGIHSHMQLVPQLAISKTRTNVR